jgi:hypothetical protein
MDSERNTRWMRIKVARLTRFVNLEFLKGMLSEKYQFCGYISESSSISDLNMNRQEEGTSFL